MNDKVIVAGGGIGGLACALALARAGVRSVVLEQAEAWGEVGAGLQLGPNAMRVLAEWGLADALRASAAYPEALRVRDAHSGGHLGHLRLGAMCLAQHRQYYATLHRADLHSLLLAALRRYPAVQVRQEARLASYRTDGGGVKVTLDGGDTVTGSALIGCDGLWSRVREQLLAPQSAPRATGHLAYRGLVSATQLPTSLRANAVTAWLGPRLHVVHYPVKQGDAINVVAVVEGALLPDAQSDPTQWTHAAHAADLRQALGHACDDLLNVVESVPTWTLWSLHDREPLQRADQQAQGRVALLGDAAHPMLPYLAQGAAMAIEDAWTLGRLLRSDVPADQRVIDWPSVFARYAQTRWPRNARVQRMSRRNGTIFHAQGALRWSRNLAMVLLGERLLDNSWLYDGPPEPAAAR